MSTISRPESQEELDLYFRKLTEFFENRIRFNAFLKMKVERLERGFARLRVPFFADLVGDPFRPALHGGVVSTLADTAGGIAAFTACRPGDLLSTVDLRVDYLRPAGEADLIADGKVLRVGNRVAVCDIVVFQEDSDKHIATGKGVYSVKRAANHELASS
jgi:uncharacterized protein (TIGR00369 family)